MTISMAAQTRRMNICNIAAEGSRLGLQLTMMQLQCGTSTIDNALLRLIMAICGLSRTLKQLALLVDHQLYVTPTEVFIDTLEDIVGFCHDVLWPETRAVTNVEIKKFAATTDTMHTEDVKGNLEEKSGSHTENIAPLQSSVMPTLQSKAHYLIHVMNYIGDGLSIMLLVAHLAEEERVRGHPLSELELCQSKAELTSSVIVHEWDWTDLHTTYLQTNAAIETEDADSLAPADKGDVLSTSDLQEQAVEQQKNVSSSGDNGGHPPQAPHPLSASTEDGDFTSNQVVKWREPPLYQVKQAIIEAVAKLNEALAHGLNVDVVDFLLRQWIVAVSSDLPSKRDRRRRKYHAYVSDRRDSSPEPLAEGDKKLPRGKLIEGSARSKYSRKHSSNRAQQPRVEDADNDADDTRPVRVSKTHLLTSSTSSSSVTSSDATSESDHNLNSRDPRHTTKAKPGSRRDSSASSSTASFGLSYSALDRRRRPYASVGPVNLGSSSVEKEVYTGSNRVDPSKSAHFAGATKNSSTSSVPYLSASHGPQSYSHQTAQPPQQPPRPGVPFNAQRSSISSASNQTRHSAPLSHQSAGHQGRQSHQSFTHPQYYAPPQVLVSPRHLPLSTPSLGNVYGSSPSNTGLPGSSATAMQYSQSPQHSPQLQSSTIFPLQATSGQGHGPLTSRGPVPSSTQGPLPAHASSSAYSPHLPHSQSGSHRQQSNHATANRQASSRSNATFSSRGSHKERNYEQYRDRDRDRPRERARESAKNFGKGIGFGAVAATVMEILSGLDGV